MGLDIDFYILDTNCSTLVLVTKVASAGEGLLKMQLSLWTILIGPLLFKYCVWKSDCTLGAD